jgi:DNA sulfur modification protein DndD
MVIREIKIENFTCYYGKKVFRLSPKLNIILGENGEGKTMFYRALDWLFRTEQIDPRKILSRKAEEELNEGDRVTVLVEILVEQYDEEVAINKYFHVEKVNSELIFHKPQYSGTVFNKITGEREPGDGRILLERIFSSGIRNYSMFKGEDELNIFQNDDALFNLVTQFSEAKYYKKYSEFGHYLKERSQKALDKAAATNRSNEKSLNILNEKLVELKGKLFDKKTLKAKLENEKDKLKSNIEEANRFVQNAEELEIYNNRIQDLDSQISHLQSTLDENYTSKLFDQYWILARFDKIKKVFEDKLHKWDVEKRALQRKHDIKIGQENAKLDLVRGVLPLPVTTPSKEHMEEMIKDLVCKVCNRGFDKGDKTHQFMQKRLEEYLQFIGEVKDSNEEAKKTLFKNDYLRSLDSMNTILVNEFNRSLKNINTEIEENIQFNNDRKENIRNLNTKREKELEGRDKLIGRSSVGAEKLGVILSDYNHWMNEKGKVQESIIGFNSQIKDLIEDIKKVEEEKSKITDNNVPDFYVEARNIFRDLEKVFVDTEDKILKDFISSLEREADRVLKTINVDAFTGKLGIELINDMNFQKITIDLFDEDGRPFSKNKSLETSMYMSVLFAIAEMTVEVKEESYPLIFDAPTSSFGETKTTQFLNLISTTNNQIIILLKDYLIRDENGDLKVKNEFENVRRDKAFWVRLERPFEPEKLSTLNTNVIEI